MPPPPPPVEAIEAPPPVYVLESEAPKETAIVANDPDLDRLRLVQRAIWKGDRPTREILAEHGLTEIEWRALKRASARKLSA
jgi:hypothetical protein